MIARPDLRCSHPECKHPILEVKDENRVSDYRCRLHGIVNPVRVPGVPVRVPTVQQIPGWEGARPEQSL